MSKLDYYIHDYADARGAVLVLTTCRLRCGERPLFGNL